MQQPWRRSGREEAGAARSFSAAVKVEDFKVEIKRTSKSSSSPSSLQFLGLNDLFASDLCFAHTRTCGKQYLISLPQFPYKIVEKSVFTFQCLASTQARKDEDPRLCEDLDRLCYDQKTWRASLSDANLTRRRGLAECWNTFIGMTDSSTYCSFGCGLTLFCLHH